MRRWTIGVMAMLAGCGQADETPPPANLTQDELVLPAASPTPETVVTIPTRFVGTWDRDGTACAATPPAATRLVVGASASSSPSSRWSR